MCVLGTDLHVKHISSAVAPEGGDAGAVISG